MPEEIQADSAGHDSSDARGRRPLLVGVVLVLPSPFLPFSPARFWAKAKIPLDWVAATPMAPPPP